MQARSGDRNLHYKLKTPSLHVKNFTTAWLFTLTLTFQKLTVPNFTKIGLVVFKKSQQMNYEQTNKQTNKQTGVIIISPGAERSTFHTVNSQSLPSPHPHSHPPLTPIPSSKPFSTFSTKQCRNWELFSHTMVQLVVKVTTVDKTRHVNVMRLYTFNWPCIALLYPCRLKPNTHHRHDATRQLSCVSGVYWALQA